MNFEYETLKHLYEKPPIGNIPPYNSGSVEQTEKYVLEVAHDLANSEILDVLISSNDLESGFASYIEIWCDKKKAQPTHRNATVTTVSLLVHGEPAT